MHRPSSQGGGTQGLGQGQGLSRVSSPSVASAQGLGGAGGSLSGVGALGAQAASGASLSSLTNEQQLLQEVEVWRQRAVCAEQRAREAQLQAESVVLQVRLHQPLVHSQRSAHL